MPEKWVLKQYQALPLQAKVNMSLNRIREWYDHFGGGVYISFSGGKDSTVLAHLVHTIYPDVPMVFSNTGLEYPEIRQFAKGSRSHSSEDAIRPGCQHIRLSTHRERDRRSNPFCQTDSERRQTVQDRLPETE